MARFYLSKSFFSADSTGDANLGQILNLQGESTENDM
jgi:hypothetical protein